MTKHHWLGGLSSRNGFSLNSGDQKSGITVLTGLLSSEAALVLHMAVLLLYLPVSFLHCVSVSWSPLIRTLTSWVRVYSCVHFILPQLSLKFSVSGTF